MDGVILEPLFFFLRLGLRIGFLAIFIPGFVAFRYFCFGVKECAYITIFDLFACYVCLVNLTWEIWEIWEVGVCAGCVWYFLRDCYANVTCGSGVGIGVIGIIIISINNDIDHRQVGQKFERFWWGEIYYFFNDLGGCILAPRELLPWTDLILISRVLTPTKISLYSQRTSIKTSFFHISFNITLSRLSSVGDVATSRSCIINPNLLIPQEKVTLLQ